MLNQESYKNVLCTKYKEFRAFCVSCKLRHSITRILQVPMFTTFHTLLLIHLKLAILILNSFMPYVTALYKQKQVQAHWPPLQNTGRLSCELYCPGFESQHRKEIFRFSKTSRLTLGPTQSPIKWVPGYFAGSKALEAWSWLGTLCRGQEWVELQHCFFYTPSWHGQG